MQIKTQNAFPAICYSEQTNIAGLFKLVRVKVRDLYTDALRNNLEITGPPYWIYTGMDGHPDTVFNLDIIIPVSKPEKYSGEFKIMEVNSIKCLSAIHSGLWEKLPETYGMLFMEIGKQGYIPTGICREVYIHLDFELPENNITEVQIGIQ